MMVMVVVYEHFDPTPLGLEGGGRISVSVLYLGCLWGGTPSPGNLPGLKAGLDCGRCFLVCSWRPLALVVCVCLLGVMPGHATDDSQTGFGCTWRGGASFAHVKR
jgi:hypothetical protein